MIEIIRSVNFQGKMGLLLGQVVLSCACFIGIQVNAQIPTDGFCLPPPRISGMLSMSPGPDLGDRYSIGASVLYTCQPGYVSQGTNPVRCANRQWTYDSNLGIPRCVPNAPVIPPVAPGQLTCPRGCPIPNTICALLEGRPTCICGPGYFEVPGSGFGSRGSCQPRTIVQPRPAAECSNRCPANSGCSFYGDRLVCICNPGYIVYQRTSCIARPGAIVVTTSRPACNRPAESPNRITLPDRNQQVWQVNERIIYACENNYIIRGSRRSICTESGSFLATPPTCTAPIPTATPRATVIPSTIPTPVSCSNPVAPANGFTSPRGQTVFGVGTFVTFGCNRGFEFRGDQTSLCQANGQFSPYSNECRRRAPPGPVRACPAPIAPPNGNFGPNQVLWTTGNTVTYTCNTGFVLNGSPIATCQADGTYTSNPPTCQGRVSCPSPVVPFGGSINDPGRVSWGPGDVVTYTCRQGFTILGGPTITCQNDGTYSAPFPSCAGQVQRTVCANPRTPTNALIAPPVPAEWTAGERVTFICRQGYILVGSGSWECQEDGTFDERATFCIVPQPVVTQPPTAPPTQPPTAPRTQPPPRPQTCPAPIPPVDGAVGNPQSTWLVDDVVVYNCNPGFEIVGASTAFCLNTGVFDPPAPRCVAIVIATPTPRVVVPASITCERLPPPENGQVLGPASQQGWQVGERLLFNCLPGYNLIGEEDVTCQADGNFDGVVPFCEPVASPTAVIQVVTCAQPQSPVNGIITNPQPTWNVGDVVNYACSPSLRLQGSASATCLGTGVFSNGPPSCAAVTVITTPGGCVVTAPINGRVEGGLTSAQTGQQVRFACDNSYTIVGDETRRCLPNGALSGEEAACTACVPQPPENGFLLPLGQRVWNFTDLISYGCSDGYRLEGFATAFCRLDGTILGETPQCTAEGSSASQRSFCTQPPPTNGFRIPELPEVGTVFQFACNPGFQLEGTFNMGICVDNGEYAIAAPTCIPS
ncbi:sushi, von Willebrand factor type A, EGF and pentraxin domain-containing protein 1-like [Clavelina lepadiformis]|uniref:sushi, von Willebrand factor type A, EGF and pentraxin domain-containing protein 1-like n=1 Tax=Clavelina lepadiformis TaxID=159417 RepID=UPI004040F709